MARTGHQFPPAMPIEPAIHGGFMNLMAQPCFIREVNLSGGRQFSLLGLREKGS